MINRKSQVRETVISCFAVPQPDRKSVIPLYIGKVWENMNPAINEVFRRYPQVGLPIAQGTRQTVLYKNAVLRGLPVAEPVENFIGDGQDSFDTLTTPAGPVDVLSLFHRADFEAAIRCLSGYCEPIDVPASMGAQTIGGLINWKKINDHKAAYLASGRTDWDEEFGRFTAVRENFRDYLIILSMGPYSAVSAREAGETVGLAFPEEEWCRLSVVIRKFHELTHFIARKLFPENKEAIRDEIIADAIGLTAAFGKYDPGLARLFLGLEKDSFREGGRLQIYYGEENPASVQVRARDLIDQTAAYLNGEYSQEPEAVLQLVCEIEKNRIGL